MSETKHTLELTINVERKVEWTMRDTITVEGTKAECLAEAERIEGLDAEEQMELVAKHKDANVMEELKNLTTLQLVSMIQDLSTRGVPSRPLFSDTSPRLKDINEVAEVLKNKLEVQAFKSVMGGK